MEFNCNRHDFQGRTVIGRGCCMASITMWRWYFHALSMTFPIYLLCGPAQLPFSNDAYDNSTKYNQFIACYLLVSFFTVILDILSVPSCPSFRLLGFISQKCWLNNRQLECFVFNTEFLVFFVPFTHCPTPDDTPKRFESKEYKKIKIWKNE